MKRERAATQIERRLSRLWDGRGRISFTLLRGACGLNQLVNALALPWICGGAAGLARAQRRAAALERMRATGIGFDAQGMLTDQPALRAEEIPFGKGTAALHGCGWMAAYNALRILGENPDPAELLQEMERGGLLLGTGGTNPFYLLHYLRRRGYRARLYTDREGAAPGLRACVAGIWLYIFYDLENDLIGAHYVALRPEGDGMLRSYNGGNGWPGDRLAPEELPMGLGRALIAVWPEEGAG